MPQMAPLMWSDLFGFFSCAFIMFVILNYFMKVPSEKISSPDIISAKENYWKW
uniref:ATP synthase F0 subunit 8 n=1 Tax=Plesionika izumiae TaxID=309573 RepID=UPI0023D82C4B|nr:ATP synthase F0 subunit 8 [Plesionika izumiae]WDD39130.1 ATP synthase F0 subunit 8 [Plesionika izumiae]